MITFEFVAVDTSMLCVGRVILITPGVALAVGAGVGDAVAVAVGVGVGDGVGLGVAVGAIVGVGVLPVIVSDPLFWLGEIVANWSSMNSKSFPLDIGAQTVVVVAPALPTLRTRRL